MWEKLFSEMNGAALATDLELYEQSEAARRPSGRAGFDFLVAQSNRFVVTSIDRGSVEIVGGILLAAGWAYKKFVEPGWDKSESKKAWDDRVAKMFDTAIPILREQVDVRVVRRLKQMKIARISLGHPFRGRRLADNSTPDVELVYAQTKQIEHLKKDNPQG